MVCGLGHSFFRTLIRVYEENNGLSLLGNEHISVSHHHNGWEHCSMLQVMLFLNCLSFLFISNSTKVIVQSYDLHQQLLSYDSHV